MAGRRPTPTIVKIRNGNPGHRPLPKNEPKPPEGIPDPPEWLSEKARRAWDVIAPLLAEHGVLTTADGAALEGLCETHADWVDAAELVRTQGMAYETTTGAGERIIRANPAMAIKADADRRRRAWLVEFGLTPAARSKVTGANGQKQADPWDDF